MLQGAKLAGGNPARGRTENDFYATDPYAVQLLLKKHNFEGVSFLEPCVGEGHIANVIAQHFPDISITAVDIVDRGYPGTVVNDYFEWEPNKRFDLIITNPPYSLAKEFVERCMKQLSSKGQLAMFLKIQFLEGKKRKELFDTYPPKYIYVFRERMAIWNDGKQFDPSTGKRWATTMCHAWYVWEKGSTSEPIIRWIERE